jgi:non-heme chloroperoxidase
MPLGWRCYCIATRMSHLTTSDNVHLNLKDWGAGRPVILMHGWPLSADTFDELAIAIADAGMRAIAYDRRGFGRSSQPWDGYNYDRLADDLADVIKYANAGNAAIVGFSMGGGEVARYMSRHGGQGVSQAVLIASVVPYMLKTADHPNGVDQKVFEQMTKAMKEDRAKFWSGFFKDFYGGQVSDEVIEWSRTQAMYASTKATLDCAQAFATTDFRPDLASFKVPTLIVHGTKDKTVPIDATARVAAKRIAGSQLIEYDGGPHGLLASHKQRVIDDVLAFLGR